MSNKSSAVRGNALSRSFSSDGSLKLFNESEVHGRQSLLIDSYPEHCIRLFPWWGRRLRIQSLKGILSSTLSGIGIA